ncbi:hypothetical protein [Halolactibacillus sp. JCM 19043]|nr:hypothetical protein [Halolactibacillus sp. JCM 19043]
MTLLLAEVKEQPLALLEIKQFCQDASVVIFPTVQAAIDHRAF